MKKLAAIALFGGLLCLAIGCKTSAPTVKSLSEYKGRKLEHGSQGGITGGGTTISILENGQVFSATTIPAAENYHGSIDSKEAKALVDEAEALVKKYAGANGTGNMTYSLGYFDGTATSSITWASETFPQEDIKAFAAQAVAKKINQYIQKAK